ncbi:SDR family oxidoreductase [Methanocalculus taiwanensis]|uniref:SDR family oxidoreductase n=1 Tax=Methanocalculus taiwanensis TaxID=106207 RepID=A0ABD4TM97_9EURY|nr:oxidoreductase [Methanocalculus taiwanensis]MCQ1539546.1 SDR family oxidoreductase [Methanocalculus taiwanensis]
MSNYLLDKKIIISGGLGLIGTKFVEVCASCGAYVTIADINIDMSNSIVDNLKEKSGNHNIFFQYCDITDPDTINEFLSTYTKKHHTVDALVNNAYPRNRNYGRKFEDVTYEDFCQNLSMHLGGYFYMSKAVALMMMKQRCGNIVNMASIYGFSAPRFDIYRGTNMTMPIEYAAIKGGIISLTKYLASYLGEYNIRVNAISPGGVETNQNESFIKKYSSRVLLGNRMAQTEDISGALIFLLGDHSKYITGHNIIIDGGWSL